MMRHVSVVLTGITLIFLATSAFAGTTTLDFATNTGLLTYSSGAGSLISQSGHGHFTGPNVTLLEQGGSVITSGGTTSISMTLRPADAGDGVALVMYAGGDELTAICSSDGTVTLWDYIGNYRTLSFSYPGAYNNTFTLQYNASTGTATLILNGSSSASLYDALEGAGSVQVGVASNGVADFYGFTATGPGIPTYPPPEVDSDGDGVMDSVETAAGTNTLDPGNLPVYNTTGAVVHALNGATVTIAAGSLPASSINLAVSAPSSIPVGSMPTGKVLSSVGVELKPNGTIFSSPVTVILPYTSGAVASIVESSLTVLYFTGSGYSASGISGVSVNSSAKTVTFTTTHFTTFALAGDSRDSDGDGIDDWWEIRWFGNLTTADASGSDYDDDDIPDAVEFQYWNLGLEPTAADGPLPVAGTLGMIALSAALVAFGIRRRS